MSGEPEPGSILLVEFDPGQVSPEEGAGMRKALFVCSANLDRSPTHIQTKTANGYSFTERH